MSIDQSIKIPLTSSLGPDDDDDDKHQDRKVHTHVVIGRVGHVVFKYAHTHTQTMSFCLAMYLSYLAIARIPCIFVLQNASEIK
jgi:hypothetical protein